MGRRSQFNEHFIKNYEKNSDKGYILEVDIEYPKKLFSLHKDFPFYQKKNQKKSKSLFEVQKTKKNMLFT